MPNFGKILKGLNKGIMKDYMEQQKKETDTKTRTSKKSKGRPKYLVKKECNCDKTHPCPLENNCNRSDVVYRVTVESSQPEHNGKYYIGSAGEFKERWANHMHTFRNRLTKQECTLKDLVWKLKDEQVDFTLKWEILKQSKSYKPGDSFCLLCMEEKLYIMDNAKNSKSINKDLMINEKCLHKNKFVLNNWKRKRKRRTDNTAS